MEFDEIQSVEFRTLFTLTEKPKPIEMVAFDVYGDNESVKKLIGGFGNLANNGWNVCRSCGEVSIDERDLRLLNDFYKLVLCGDFANLNPHGMTRQRVVSMVKAVKHEVTGN